MKKFLSIFAAMLVALAVNAQTDFAAPGYYCSADAGVISGDAPATKVYLNETADPHQIEWYDVSKTYTAVITWQFEATKACYITVGLDLGTPVSSNKHIFEVKLLDANNNELGVLEEGPAYTGDGFTESEQVKTLAGKLMIPAAGAYKIELRNNRDFCKGSIRNIILTYAGEAPITDFAAPGYYCAADDAVIEGDAPANKVYLNESADPHQIEWSDVSKTYTAAATWKFIATRGCYVTVALDLGTPVSSNKHIFDVELLDAAGNVLDTIAEGPDYTGDGFTESEQVKTLTGTILVPEAGNYTLKLMNHRDFCKGSIKNVILTYAADAPEPLMKTIYCKMNQDWWKADGAAVAVYTWDDKGAAKAVWPGERMAPVEGETDVWSFELDINKYKMCIFTRVNGEGEIADWGAKTGDLTIPTDENDMFTIANTLPCWNGEECACDGAWSKYEATPIFDEWAEIIFTEAIAADDLAEDASFTAPGSEFALTIHDEGNKMAIDANDCRFGSEGGYKMYNFRIKSGGASSTEKNYFTLNIPEAGTLRLAPRTGSNSATDRALVITQGENELYNQIIQESQAIEITEGENTVKVYPYVVVAVEAGDVRISYSAGMNFYAFAFKAEEEPQPELPYIALIGEMNGWDGGAANQLIPAEDGLTASATFDIAMNDNSGYGFKILVGEMSLSAYHDGSDWYGIGRDAAPVKLNWVDKDSDPMWLAMDVAGEYTFTYTYADSTLVVTFPALQPASYYLVGSMTNWALIQDEQYLFSLNPENEEEYMYTTTLAIGDEFKAVKVQGETQTWVPDGMGNNYVVDAAHAGEKTIYFRPDGKGGEGWHYGYFYIEANKEEGINHTDASMKAVKTIENGQLIIIENGVRYNAIGTIVK